MSSISKSAICPFYRSDKEINGKKILTCEGFIKTRPISTFMGREDFKKYTDKFCKNDWQNCEYARFCSTKYIKMHPF